MGRPIACRGPARRPVHGRCATVRRLARDPRALREHGVLPAETIREGDRGRRAATRGRGRCIEDMRRLDLSPRDIDSCRPDGHSSTSRAWTVLARRADHRLDPQSTAGTPARGRARRGREVELPSERGDPERGASPWRRLAAGSARFRQARAARGPRAWPARLSSMTGPLAMARARTRRADRLGHSGIVTPRTSIAGEDRIHAVVATGRAGLRADHRADLDALGDRRRTSRALRERARGRHAQSPPSFRRIPRTPALGSSA